MGNTPKELSSAKTNKGPGALWFINMSEEEEKLFLSPFYSSRYFSQPKDFLIHVSFPKTGHWQLDIRLLGDCFEEWRPRGRSVSSLFFFLSPSESAHETFSAAPASNF